MEDINVFIIKLNNEIPNGLANITTKFPKKIVSKVSWDIESDSQEIRKAAIDEFITKLLADMKQKGCTQIVKNTLHIFNDNELLWRSWQMGFYGFADAI